MIEFYHLPPTRSVRVAWVLDELGLDYQAHEVLWPVRERQPEYLKLNPAGTIPTLVDGEVVITESMAACEYLARTYGDGQLTLDPGDDGYYAYLSWMWFGEATLGPQLGNMMRYGPSSPDGRHYPDVAADALEAYRSRLPVVEQGLSGDGFAAGDRLTLADVSLGYALFVGALVGLAGEFGPNTTAYFARISARPAFQRATGGAPA